MARARPAAVAGTFYPADAHRLRDQLERLMAEASSPASATPRAPSAIIAPHAGYIYSGPIAATAFGAVSGDDSSFERVVVIGPSHFVPFRGIALPEVDLIVTPLGSVELDAAGCELVAALPQVVVADEPHRREHAVEVEVPFLQAVLGDFSIVPLVTGSVDAEEVAEVLEALWDARTLVVVSSDLSHFYDYNTARRLDRSTAEAIVGLRSDDLGEGSACGRLAIQGLLRAAAGRNRDVSLLDLRNSGDTAGTRDEVVGYGAFSVA